MSALELFESFCWGVTGGSAVLITQNGVKLHGYRKTRKDDHRGASPAGRSRTLHVSAAGTDSQAGDGSSLTPDAIEPIVGFRGWSISYGGFLVSNGGSGDTWPAKRALKATCKYDAHPSPSRKCMCGIYAVKAEPKMQVEGGQHGGPYAWGRVAIWGRVEEAEDGYRAEFAYPISITVIDAPYINRISMYQETPEQAKIRLDKLLDDLVLHYGVPVRIGSTDELEEAKRASYDSLEVPPEVKELVG